MAVGVGLDDGVELDVRTDQLAEDADVVAQCVLVDLEPHPPRQWRQARPRRAARRWSSALEADFLVARPSTSSRRASGRTCVSSEASSPASPDPLAGQLAGTSRADKRPSTRRVVGVERPVRGASRSCRQARRRFRPWRARHWRTRRPATLPSGAATTVRAPLSTTTAPNFLAASLRATGTLVVVRARPATPVSRPNSPGCGVSTSGRLTSVHQSSAAPVG